jgi:hypothetical protein
MVSFCELSSEGAYQRLKVTAAIALLARRRGTSNPSPREKGESQHVRPVLYYYRR